MKEIIHNYTAFYNMVLLTTLLANKNNEAYEQDAKKLIRFVGEAYSLSKELIEYASPTKRISFLASCSYASLFLFAKSVVKRTML